MNAIMNKTNTGKLLVAVLAMAMVVAGCAVLFNGEETNAQATDDPAEATYNGIPSDFETAYNAATAEGATVKTITLNKNVTIADPKDGTSWDFSGLTIEVGTYTLTLESTDIVGGTFNGNGGTTDGKELTTQNNHGQIINLSGTSCNITGSTLNLKIGADGGIPRFAINAGGVSGTISNVTINSEASGYYGAIYTGGNLEVNNCTMPNGKINYVGNTSQTLELVDMPNAILQVNGTKTIDLKNFTLTKSNIATVVVGWGVNDSALTAHNSGYGNGDITFNNTGSNTVNLGNIVEGDDPNSQAAQNESKEITISSTNNNIEFNTSELITKSSTGAEIISGTISENTDYSNTTNYPQGVQFQNVTVNPGVTITVPATVSTYGYFNLYGTIDSNAAATVTVTGDATFTAYTGAYLGENVVILGNGEIDLSAAMYTGSWSQDIVTSIELSQIQRVVVSDTITIYSGRTFSILGELVIEEGATIIIQPGATLQIGSTEKGITATGMTVNGTIEVGGTQTTFGKIDVQMAQEVTVGGEILSEGLIDINSKVTIENGGSIDVMEGDNSSLEVSSGLTVETGGELTISSEFKTSGINNNGTVTLDHAILVGDDGGNVVINLTSDNAVVNIESATSASAVNFVIRDYGLVFEYKNGEPVEGMTVVSDMNVVMFQIGAGSGVRGMAITESVDSVREDGVNKYSNSMIVSGSVNVESDDDNAEVTVVFTSYSRDDAGDSGFFVEADSSLSFGKNVTGWVNAGVMYVNGTITATAEGADFNTNKGGAPEVDVYVNGLITVRNADSNTEYGMNAFHYDGTGETADYDYYTTLPVSLENSTDITFIGEVTVLENATIPDGTRLTAADGTSVMNIGDEDNRDILVTVQNGGSIRNGTVNVYATLVFENNSRDNRVGSNGNGVYSDVKIDEDPMMTYTNIYTALADAQDETITISRTGASNPVVLNADITIPETVTLVVPAGSYVNMYNGVTMTVDGILRNSGTIANVADPDDEDDVAAGFNPEVNGEPNTDAAAIVVNGTFMSLNEIPFDTVGATQGYYIPGAYYQIIDSNGAWYYVTPIEQAATVSGDVNNGQIDIKGEVETADVAFTGDEDVPVTVSVIGDLAAGTVTLSYATLEVETTGSYTGSVANTAGSVDLTNVKNVTVQGTVDDDEASTVLLVINGTPVAADADADSAVSIATGTVNAGAQLTVNTNIGGTVTQIVDEFTVASGAQLTVDNANFTADEISVDGTLYAVNGGKVTVDTLTVRGTFTVAANDTANHITAGVADIDTLYIGIALDDEDGTYVDASAATVNADNLGSRLSTVYVSAESTFDGKLTQTMDHTEFYVEDALWMTVYTNDRLNIRDVDTTEDGQTITNYNFVPGDLQSSAFVSWMNADGKDVNENTRVGAPGYEQVYANIDYNVYGVVITVDNSIGSVAIDGQLLTYNSEAGGYIIPGDDPLLTAGQHTVTYTLAAGYEGTPTLASNGTNVTVSGMNFTLSGDFLKSDGTLNVNYLTLGGATYSGNTVVIDGGNGGSNDMGLTDYLLIILVILIVIMAIIVALRLMRS